MPAMRVLTAGFKTEQAEMLGERARIAGHTVVSGATLQTIKVLLASARPEMVLLSDRAPKALSAWLSKMSADLPELLVCDVEEACEVFAVDASVQPPPVHQERSTRVPRASLPATTSTTLPAETKALNPTPTGSAESGADLDRKLSEVRFADYHRVLEIERGASTYLVRTAYERLSACYAPENWPSALVADELLQLQEIQSGLRDALALLGQPKFQALYEDALNVRDSHPIR